MSEPRRRYSVGVVKIPYADRDVAHAVLTPRDPRGFRDVIGADTSDHDSRFPVGAEVSYSVELTEAEAQAFAAASNARYVEIDQRHLPARAIGRPTGTAPVPTDATLAYMRARYVDLRRWHGRDVRVAILDQGTTAAVREKMGWSLVARTVTGGVTIAAGEEIGRPAEDHSHGCLVAPNGVPAGGLLLDCVICEDDGSAFASAEAAGIRWAVDNAAKVINLSFASAPGTVPQVMLDAADYAAAAGVQIVMAAGNENLADIAVPSSMSRTKTNCHSSISFDESTDRRALFSNHHADGSGCAPGVDVTSFDTLGNRVRWNGTSASSPHMAQLIARGCTGATFTPAQVAAALRANPRSTGAAASEQGAGAWDLQRALAALGVVPSTPTAAGVTTPSVVDARGAAGLFTGYTLAAPAGIAADDVRIVVIVASVDAQVTVPDGWSMLFEEHYYAGFEASQGLTVDPGAVFILAKPYVAGEPEPASLLFGSTWFSAMGCLTVRAAGGLDPERFSPQVRFGTGSAVPTLPVLPASTNDLLVCAFSQRQAESPLGTLSVPGGLTQQGLWRPASGTTGYPLMIATTALVSGARTAAYTSTANSSGTWCSVAFTVPASAAAISSTASPGDAPGSTGGFLSFYPGGSAQPGAQATSPSQGSTDVGVWVPNPYDGATSWAAALSAFDSSAGGRPNVAHVFLGWTDTATGFPSVWADAARARGQRLAITWEPWDGVSGATVQANYQLADIIAGTYDSYITTFAQQAASYGQPVFLRPMHEMNGNWYPWSPGVNGNTLGQYAQAWQRIRNIFTAQGASNVSFVWCPNISFTGSGYTALAGLYPGDAYVDYIGLDGYNFGGTDWTEFSDVFTSSITEIRTVAPAKPLLICETSSSETGGNKATWIANMWTYLAAHPEIRGLWWFNENKENDWRIESTTAARNAFSAGYANARYIKAS